MPTTPLGLRYPNGTDPANVPADLAELATDVDNLAKQIALPRVTSAGAESALGTTVGQMCYRADLGRHRIRTAAGWRDALPRVVFGNAPVASAGTSMGTGAVGFGADGPFAAPPTVLTGSVVAGGGQVISTYAVSITTTQFTLRWVATATVSTASTVPWVAVGWAA